MEVCPGLRSLTRRPSSVPTIILSYLYDEWILTSNARHVRVPLSYSLLWTIALTNHLDKVALWIQLSQSGQNAHISAVVSLSDIPAANL
jgi:hypothetical protein